MVLSHRFLLQPGRDGRKDGLLRKPIEVLDDKVSDAIVEHLAVITHYQLVAKPVTFIEGELVRIVVLNLTDVQKELGQGFLGEIFCARLN